MASQYIYIYTLSMLVWNGDHNAATAIFLKKCYEFKKTPIIHTIKLEIQKLMIGPTDKHKIILN